MKIFDFAQYSPEWLAARRGVPTASEFSEIMTPVTMKMAAAAKTYMCQLIGDLFDPDYGQVDDKANAAMQRGTALEPESRDWYAMDSGEEVRQVGFCLTDDGRFGCSPDGLVSEDGGLELKNPKPKQHVAYLLAGPVVPPDYLAQVHGSLIVTGRKWWDWVSYCPGAPQQLRVRTTPNEYTAALAKMLDNFWKDYQAALTKIRG